MKLKKILAYVTALAIVFSIAATVTASSSVPTPSTPDSWWEFDKASGGWWVTDISRGADGVYKDKDDNAVIPTNNHGHRMQIIPFGTHACPGTNCPLKDDCPGDEMPEKGKDYDAILRLPEFANGGDEFPDLFTGIAQVRATIFVEWEKWDVDARQDFEIVVHNTIDGFKQVKEGGALAKLLEGLEEDEDGNPIDPPDFSKFPNPISMITNVTTYTPPLPPFTPEVYTDWFKVMVTNWSWAAQVQTPPVKALVHLLDHNGDIIKLVCPTCDKSPCTCNCPGGCGKKATACECPCATCGEPKTTCTCCKVCKNKKAECVCTTVKPPDPPPPPPTQNEVVKNFPTWKSSTGGNAEIITKADHTKFSKLWQGGEVVPPQHYEVKAGTDPGTTAIIIKEAYFKTFNATRTLNFVAEFSDRTETKFSILVELSTTQSSATPPATTPRNNNDTNPRTGVVIAIIPALIAAGAVIATTRKKKG